MKLNEMQRIIVRVEEPFSCLSTEHRCLDLINESVGLALRS